MVGPGVCTSALHHMPPPHTVLRWCHPPRQVCNHPMLSYPPETWAVGDAIVRQCGKMLVLDRFLVKMKLSGHR